MGFAFLTKQQLEQDTPSRKDTITAGQEWKMRRTDIRFIEQACSLLKLPMWAAASACTFYHRFFTAKSMTANDRFLVCTACVFLASKVEDNHRALVSVAEVCYAEKFLKKKPQQRQQLVEEKFMEDLKEWILSTERSILFALGFELYVTHPYNFFYDMHKTHPFLTEPDFKSLKQATWNFLNDSRITTLCLQYEAATIAKAALHLSAKLLKKDLPLPEGRTFYQEFDITPEVVEDISLQLLDLYESKPKQAAADQGAATVDTQQVDSHTPAATAPQHTATDVTFKPEQQCPFDDMVCEPGEVVIQPSAPTAADVANGPTTPQDPPQRSANGVCKAESSGDTGLSPPTDNCHDGCIAEQGAVEQRPPADKLASRKRKTSEQQDAASTRDQPSDSNWPDSAGSPSKRFAASNVGSP